MEIAIFTVGWIGAGLVASGFGFAFFQRSYPTLRKEHFHIDRRQQVTLGVVCGPMALLVNVAGLSCHGWLWPWSEKAKREAGLA